MLNTVQLYKQSSEVFQGELSCPNRQKSFEISPPNLDNTSQALRGQGDRSGKQIHSSTPSLQPSQKEGLPLEPLSTAPSSSSYNSAISQHAVTGYCLNVETSNTRGNLLVPTRSQTSVGYPGVAIMFDLDDRKDSNS